MESGRLAETGSLAKRGQRHVRDLRCGQLLVLRLVDVLLQEILDLGIQFIKLPEDFILLGVELREKRLLQIRVAHVAFEAGGVGRWVESPSANLTARNERIPTVAVVSPGQDEQAAASTVDPRNCPADLRKGGWQLAVSLGRLQIFDVCVDPRRF